MVKKQISVQKHKKIARKNKQISLMLALVLILSLLLTGCQAVSETFGKKYIKIDEFFEQMEADIIFSCQEYYNENGIQGEAASDDAVELAIERLNDTKEAWKEDVRLYDGSMAELENAMDNVREQLTQELAEAGVELKSTTVERGLLGSIWHFIRKHWLISLIILGIIGNIYEKIEDFIDMKQKKEREKAEAED